MSVAVALNSQKDSRITAQEFTLRGTVQDLEGADVNFSVGPIGVVRLDAGYELRGPHRGDEPKLQDLREVALEGTHDILARVDLSSLLPPLEAVGSLSGKSQLYRDTFKVAKPILLESVQAISREIDWDEYYGRWGTMTQVYADYYTGGTYEGGSPVPKHLRSKVTHVWFYVEK